MPRAEAAAAPRLLSDPAELIAYESDAGFDRGLADAVSLPATAAEVESLVREAARRGWPVVARGAGTGLSGGAVATRGGVVVSTARMDGICEIDRVGRTVKAGAGAVNQLLAERVQGAGLYFPPDPSSGRSCCIGGNVGTNAGGPHCFKYGVTTHYVQALEAVLADGSSTTLGSLAPDAPGLDLCGLVVGSEGTLAVVTAAHLRLVRQPPEVQTMMAAFASLEAAGAAVSAVISAGLVPATLEAIDQRGMLVIEQFHPAGLPVDAGAVLIAEVDGYSEGLAAQAAELAQVFREHGAVEVKIAESEAERDAIWFGRKSAAGAMARLAPRYYLTDITVRRSRLASVLAAIHEICDRYGLETASFFHAGDGNLHPLIPCDPRDAGLMSKVGAAMEEILALCIAEDGSITGEHGVGVEKRSQLAAMYGAAELAAMRDVKEVFDPDGRLNPGKVLPEELPPAEPIEAAAQLDESLEPGSDEEAAAQLRALAESGRRVRIDGAADGRDADGVARLSTAGLAGVRLLAPEDLFVSVGAGTALDELKRELDPHGVLLPLTSPWPGTTVGSAVAASLNAPWRLRYGPIRDLALSMTVALADGRLIRTGRPLVKNVAGYDLGKAFVGSHGTLGLLTEVTLKLVPRPRARRTLAFEVADLAAGWRLAVEARDVALLASGIALERAAGSGWRLLFTVEGDAAGVDAELRLLADRLRALGGRAQPWERSATESWARFLSASGEAASVRVGVPPGRLGELVSSLPEAAERWCDCGSGLVYLLDRGSLGRLPTWLPALRERAVALGGYAATAAPAEATCEERWGPPPAGFGLMERLKRRWDPRNVLNPGVFLFPAECEPREGSSSRGRLRS